MMNLNFDIIWTSESSGRRMTAADATRGKLKVSLGDTTIWGQNIDGTLEGFEWTWVDLLEHLNHAWPFLAWEEGFPLGLGADDPFRLRNEAEKRWTEMPDELVRSEENELWAFMETHDLAMGVHGAWLPSILLLREGNCMWVSSKESRVLTSLTQTMDALSAIGDKISSRLEKLRDERSISAVEEWKNRTKIDSRIFAEANLRAPGGDISKLDLGVNDLSYFELDEGNLEPNELVALTRMSGGRLSAAVLISILDNVKKIQFIKSEIMMDMSREAMDLLSCHSDKKPFDQGYIIANWLRTKQIPGTGRAKSEPFDLLNYLGISYFEIEIDDPNVEAVGCWGKRHGPAILLNTKGKRAQDPHGKRSTAAHEICHVLIDRSNSLPFAELANLGAPRNVEGRANAFAAEFLLPREEARRRIVSAGIGNYRNAARILSQEYEVSMEIVAWQAKNAPGELDRYIREQLREYVSEPLRY